MLKVSSNKGESWRLAGAATAPSGIPPESTTTERLRPRFPPIYRASSRHDSPPQGALVMQPPRIPEAEGGGDPRHLLFTVVHLDPLFSSVIETLNLAQGDPLRY